METGGLVEQVARSIHHHPERHIEIRAPRDTLSSQIPPILSALEEAPGRWVLVIEVGTIDEQPALKILRDRARTS